MVGLSHRWPTELTNKEKNWTQREASQDKLKPTRYLCACCFFWLWWSSKSNGCCVPSIFQSASTLANSSHGPHREGQSQTHQVDSVAVTKTSALMEKTGQKTWNQSCPHHSGRYVLQTWLGGLDPAGRLVLSSSKTEDLTKTVWGLWSQPLNLPAVWVWTSCSSSLRLNFSIFKTWDTNPASWSYTYCSVWHQSWYSLHSISLSPNSNEWISLT